MTGRWKITQGSIGHLAQDKGADREPTEDHYVHSKIKLFLFSGVAKGVPWAQPTLKVKPAWQQRKWGPKLLSKCASAQQQPQVFQLPAQPRAGPWGEAGDGAAAVSWPALIHGSPWGSSLLSHPHKCTMCGSTVAFAACLAVSPWG